MNRRLPLLIAARRRRRRRRSTTPSAAARGDIVLTGIVTTDDVIVSSEVQGRLQELLAQGGRRGQAGAAARRHPAAGVEGRRRLLRRQRAAVRGAGRPRRRPNLRFQEAQTEQPDPPGRGQSRRGARRRSRRRVADLENARLTFEREEAMYRKGVESAQAFDQARTAYDAAKAHVEALRKQAAGRRGGRRAGQGQRRSDRRAPRRARWPTSTSWRRSGAQKEKAQVHLDYTEIRAPIDGVVDVRAALQGEVVEPGPGDRHADRSRRSVGARRRRGELHRPVRLGDKMTVRLPSGAERDVRRSSIAASMPTTPRSATSAAPSATSRPSRSACAATTPTAASPSA